MPGVDCAERLSSLQRPRRRTSANDLAIKTGSAQRKADRCSDQACADDEDAAHRLRDPAPDYRRE